MLAVMNSTTCFHPITPCHTQSFDILHIPGLGYSHDHTLQPNLLQVNRLVASLEQAHHCLATPLHHSGIELLLLLL